MEDKKLPELKNVLLYTTGDLKNPEYIKCTPDIEIWQNINALNAHVRALTERMGKMEKDLDVTDDPLMEMMNSMNARLALLEEWRDSGMNALEDSPAPDAEGEYDAVMPIKIDRYQELVECEERFKKAVDEAREWYEKYSIYMGASIADKMAAWLARYGGEK